MKARATRHIQNSESRDEPKNGTLQFCDLSCGWASGGQKKDACGRLKFSRVGNRFCVEAGSQIRNMAKVQVEEKTKIKSAIVAPQDEEVATKVSPKLLKITGDPRLCPSKARRVLGWADGEKQRTKNNSKRHLQAFVHLLRYFEH